MNGTYLAAGYAASFYLVSIVGAVRAARKGKDANKAIAVAAIWPLVIVLGVALALVFGPALVANALVKARREQRLDAEHDGTAPGSVARAKRAAAIEAALKAVPRKGPRA